MKSKIVIVLLMTVTIIAGCGGRAANPIMLQQYGDDRKSCRTLEQEMTLVQGEIQRLIPETEKTGKNVTLGVAGLFFIFPWFFMDLSKAEQMEVNAFRQRYNHLLIIATEKQCGIKRIKIPDLTKPQNNISGEE